MFRFLPKEEKFFDMFEQSTLNVLKGGRLFLELIKDSSNLEEKVRAIKDVEHEGDRITHETVERLNRTFVTPIDREDIHSLINRIDDVIDLIETSAEKILLYKITEFDQETLSLTELLVKSIEELVDATLHLKNLKKPKKIISHCIEINRLENKADEVYRKALSSLFNNVTDPIKIIKWKDIYGDLEMAIDKCEDVANILEGVVLKNV